MTNERLQFEVNELLTPVVYMSELLRDIAWGVAIIATAPLLPFTRTRELPKRPPRLLTSTRRCTPLEPETGRDRERAREMR